MFALPCVRFEYLRWRYHLVLLSRLAFCAFILLLDRAPQLRTPMAVETASFSSASSEFLSNRLVKIAIAFWYSIQPLAKSAMEVDFLTWTEIELSSPNRIEWRRK